MATESSLVDVAPKWSNPATNIEWPSGGGCCCFCSGLRLLAPFAVGSQAALPFPDLPFVCSFTFFIVSAVSLVVVVVGLTALCLVDFSCVRVCVCPALQPQEEKQLQLQLRLRLRCRWKVLSKMLPKCLTFCTVSVASCDCVRPPSPCPCPCPCVRVVATWGTLAHRHTHTDTCK